MYFYRLISVILALLPFCTFGTPVVQCHEHHFLSKGIDLKAIQSCHEKLDACRFNSATPPQNCVQELIKSEKACTQLRMLAKTLQASPTMLTFQKEHQFILIDQYFIADGQHSYYIFTPKNCLINTKIDPRTLNKSLQKAYKHVPFIITNWNKPIFKVGNNQLIIESTLKITKTCLACEVVGYAKINFIFDDKNKLHAIQLVDNKLLKQP